jgi:hypothetical protein
MEDDRSASILSPSQSPDSAEVASSPQTGTILKVAWLGMSLSPSGKGMIETHMCVTCPKHCEVKTNISEKPPTDCIKGLLAE